MIDYPKKNKWFFWTPEKENPQCDKLPYILNKKEHMAYDRWVSQFLSFTKLNDLNELVNLKDEDIEEYVFNFILEQRKIYTEITVMQKTTAVISFFYFHNIEFLSDRIVNQFPNTPLFHLDKYNIIFKVS